MAWNDAPPTKAELAPAPKASWADAPPTKDELKAPVLQGDTPDNPGTTDLYGGSGLERAKAGFGDPKGLAQILAAHGYTDVQKNKDGDIVVKGTGGKYFRDDNRFFEGHPVNWLESAAGKALPLAGTVGGAIAGNVPGALLGGAGGEAIRQGAGRLMGVNDQDLGDAAQEIGKEGLMGGAAEVGGKYIAAPVLKYLTQKFGPLVKGGVARASSLMTSVPHEAIERLIERPGEVMGASAKGKALEVARGAQAEFKARAAAEDAAIGTARKSAVAQHGEADVDTGKIGDDIAAFQGEHAPVETAGGTIQGPVTPGEHAALGRFQQILAGDGDGQVKFGHLQKLADEIQTQIDLGKQAIAPGSKATRGQGFMGSLYGKIKGAMHEVSPELAAADAKYAGYATDADRLGKLEEPDKMEGFINQYYGPNKSIMQESAEKIIPDSLAGIQDMGASRAFTKQGPAGSEMGKRSIMSAGAALGILGHGHDLAHMALAGAAGAATSPGLHKAIIGNGSKLVSAVMDNPALLKSVTNPELRNYLSKMLEGGRAMPQFAETGDRGTASEDRAFKLYGQGAQTVGDDAAKSMYLKGN